jgi:tryptophanyl-tRNA synthetase
MEKQKMSKSYKQNTIEDSCVNLNSTKEELCEKVEVTKKKVHKKSNSNVEEFAFGEKSKLDEQLHNFVNNYDGKFYYLIFRLNKGNKESSKAE